jgi:hypothetical protein
LAGGVAQLLVTGSLEGEDAGERRGTAQASLKTGALGGNAVEGLVSELICLEATPSFRAEAFKHDWPTATSITAAEAIHSLA